MAKLRGVVEQVWAEEPSHVTDWRGRLRRPEYFVTIPRLAKRVVAGNQAREEVSFHKKLATDDAPEETDFLWMKVDSSAAEGLSEHVTIDGFTDNNCGRHGARGWSVVQLDHVG